jgi:hypothetical protein
MGYTTWQTWKNVSAMVSALVFFRYRGHCILFHDASILNTSARYMDRNIREATEVVLRPFNVKKADGFCLSKKVKLSP